MTISEIGKKDQNRSIGFTLLELIIVATIILVLVAVSTPLFRTSFSDLELKDAAYNISKLIRYGQQRAVIEEKKYRLLFDFARKNYHLLAEEEEGERADIAVEGRKHPGWKSVQGRFGKYFSLPEGVKFSGEHNSITFLPNGRCNEISLYVIDKKKKSIEIKTNGRAGYVEVSEVKGEE